MPRSKVTTLAPGRWSVALTASVALVAGNILAAQESPRPNIVLIVADDFGYGDLSVHGCRDTPTPHLNSIAAGGIRCTHGYVSAPQCSPTRAGLMTGRYQQRFGHEHNSAHADSTLPLSEKVIPELLRSTGYRTGMVGKWHLGLAAKHHPLERGFEEFFGFVGGANPYLPQGPMRVVPRILRGREEAREKEYLTDAFAREAVAYIERHAREPFFLYLAFNAPHGPLQASEKYLERFAGIADEKRRTYAAMVSAMDDAVGAVLKQLRDSGIEQNTLIFFISDNGGPTDVNGSLNTPFRGVKGEVREGGIRSPFFVQWKAKLPAGRVYEQPVIQLDILPTILSAAGIPPSGAKLDGVDLLPYLTGRQSGDPHQTLYWRFNFPPNQPTRHKWAIRQGNWKLFTDLDNNRKQGDRATAAESFKLVNLAEDVREEHDLSSEHPDKVIALNHAWHAWNAQLAEPGGTAKP